MDMTKEIWKKSGKGNEETYTSKTPERKISVTFNYKYKEVEIFYRNYITNQVEGFICNSVEQCNEICRRKNIPLYLPNDLQY